MKNIHLSIYIYTLLTHSLCTYITAPLPQAPSILCFRHGDVIFDHRFIPVITGSMATPTGLQPRITIAADDCTWLRYAGSTFKLITHSFGNRNVTGSKFQVHRFNYKSIFKMASYRNHRHRLSSSKTFKTIFELSQNK